MKEKLSAIVSKIKQYYTILKRLSIQIFEKLDILVRTDKVRASFYSLPFFILWIIPITWEKNPQIIRAGYRSMTLALGFFGSLIFIYLTSGAVISFFPSAGYYSRMYAFGLHTIVSLIYTGFSIFLSITEYKSKPLELGRFDRASENLVALLQK